MTEILLVLLAIFSGTILPIQAAVNARLSQGMSHPLQASFVSFASGTLVLLLVCLAGRWPVPGFDTLAALPKWSWTGGALGVIFVTAAIVLATRLGATTLVGCILAGQLLAGLVIDHWGLLGMPQHAFNPGRFVGVCLLLAGVVVLRRW